MENLEFKESTHQYFYKGREVPSVTQIIGNSNPKALEDIPLSILENASVRGTAIHQAIEFFNKYSFVNIDKEYEGYFEGYKSWHKKYSSQFSKIESEIQVCHPILNYAGTIDMLITDNEGKKIIIDVKTTRQLNMNYVSVQLSAYQDALENQTEKIKIDNRYVLWLKKDGTYEYKQVPNKKNIFMYALALNNFWKGEI